MVFIHVLKLKTNLKLIQRLVHDDVRRICKTKKFRGLGYNSRVRQTFSNFWVIYYIITYISLWRTIMNCKLTKTRQTIFEHHRCKICKIYYSIAHNELGKYQQWLLFMFNFYNNQTNQYNTIPTLCII